MKWKFAQKSIKGIFNSLTLFSRRSKYRDEKSSIYYYYRKQLILITHTLRLHMHVKVFCAAVAAVSGRKQSVNSRRALETRNIRFLHRRCNIFPAFSFNLRSQNSLLTVSIWRMRLCVWKTCIGLEMMMMSGRGRKNISFYFLRYIYLGFISFALLYRRRCRQLLMNSWAEQYDNGGGGGRGDCHQFHNIWRPLDGITFSLTSTHCIFMFLSVRVSARTNDEWK